MPWWQPRAWGPVTGMRWDPHHPPESVQPDRAVLYTAETLGGAAVETWQAGRVFLPAMDAPVVAQFTPIRPLRLLDLTADGLWAIRNGASAGLVHTDRRVCRRWAEAILDADPDIEGLLAPSMWHGRNVVLFPQGAEAVSSRNPDLLLPAADPFVLDLLREIAKSAGFEMVSA